MGVRLIVEVLDYAPASLTPRERWFLVVLAESARDHTRVCWPGVEDDETFIHRTRIASRSQRYSALKSLIEKGALENVVRGQKGVRASYRIPNLAPEGAMLPPAQGPGNPDPEAPAQRPGFRDDSPQGPGNQDAENPDAERSGSGFSNLRVPETRTPSPQSPVTTSADAEGANGEDGAIPGMDVKPSPKKKPKPKKPAKPPTPAQIEARKITDGYFKKYGNGSGQPKVSVRKLVETALNNGTDRDTVAWAVDAIGRTGKSVTAWRLTDTIAEVRARRGETANSMASQRTAARCTEHTLPLPCSSCLADIRAGDDEVPRRLLAEHGPQARPDLAERLNQNGAAA